MHPHYKHGQPMHNRDDAARVKIKTMCCLPDLTDQKSLHTIWEEREAFSGRRRAKARSA